MDTKTKEMTLTRLLVHLEAIFMSANKGDREKKRKQYVKVYLFLLP